MDLTAADPPPTLHADAKALWWKLRCMHAESELPADDQVLLNLTASTAARLAQIEEAFETEDLLVLGSKKQPRANPLIQAEVSLRRQLHDQLERWSNSCEAATIRDAMKPTSQG